MELEPDLLSRTPAERMLALGNQAVARNAIEAGVQLTTGYPGTPSTEIMVTLIEAAPTLGLSAFCGVSPEQPSFPGERIARR